MNLTGVPDLRITTGDVNAALEASGKPLREWGVAADGTPLLSAIGGGDRKPGIFITAGAHCSESAGVHASLRLLDSLETERELHVLPLRDPIGFAGISHCLSVAVGEPVEAGNPENVLDFLRGNGREIWREGNTRLFQVGEAGFIWTPPRPDLESFWEEFGALGRLAREEGELMKPLRGRSIFLVNAFAEIEGAGEIGRCWHSVLSAQGEWLHLNRFFGRDDAPPEVAAVEKLIREMEPGLICDLHEGNGQGFWMPIPRPEQDADLVLDMTRAYFAYIDSRDFPVTDYEDWQKTDRIGAPDPDWMLPEPTLPGMFWLNQDLRAEGHNLMSFASPFGIGYGTEAPMIRPLAMRVDGITEGMRAAIGVWEKGV